MINQLRKIFNPGAAAVDCVSLNIAEEVPLSTAAAGGSPVPLDHNKIPMREFFVGTPPHQMYVQCWRPLVDVVADAPRMIMVHGGAHSGTTWTSTPDGRPGWAFEFIARGWEVYVVDWPGAGRSGTRPENIADRAKDLVEPLVSLLNRIGPSVLVGHSIGASLSFQTAERIPHSVRAIASITSASVEMPVEALQLTPPDQWSVIPAEVARSIFASAPRFPQKAFDDYALSLIPFPTHINNAALGLNDDLKTRRESNAMWGKTIPVLVLAAEADQTVPLARAQQTSAALGVPLTILGADWGLPGFGHLCIVEQGSELIAARVDEWLKQAIEV